MSHVCCGCLAPFWGIHAGIWGFWGSLWDNLVPFWLQFWYVPGTPKFRVPGTSVSGRHRVALSTLSVRVGTTPSDTFNSVNVFGKQNSHICSPHTVELSTFDRRVQSSVTHPAHVLTMIYIGFVIVHPAHVLIMSSSCPHVLIMSSS